MKKMMIKKNKKEEQEQEEQKRQRTRTKRTRTTRKTTTTNKQQLQRRRQQQQQQQHAFFSRTTQVSQQQKRSIILTRFKFIHWLCARYKLILWWRVLTHSISSDHSPGFPSDPINKWSDIHLSRATHGSTQRHRHTGEFPAEIEFSSLSIQH